jgi:hypothetical protein
MAQGVFGQLTGLRGAAGRGICPKTPREASGGGRESGAAAEPRQGGVPQVLPQAFGPAPVRQPVALSLSPADPAAGCGAGPGDLAFRLVESLISLRADGMATPASPLQAADAGLILCGLGAQLPAIRLQSAEFIERLG